MKITPLQGKQQGFAALIVAITLVVILSLLTVGFAQLMRNEQNQNTNRQLSDQAYYAAETGINDATMALQSYKGAKTYCGAVNNTQDPTNAANTTVKQYLSNQSIGPSSNPNSPQWTCLLIYPAPTSLQYGDVDTTVPTTFITSAQDSSGTAQPITKLVLSWSDSTHNASPTFMPSSGISNNTAFPPNGTWSSSVGVLRTAITPLPAAALTSNALDQNTFTTYLYPNKNTVTPLTPKSVPYTATNNAAQGQIVDGNCDSTVNPRCSIVITFGAGLPAGEPILFNLRSIYNPSSLTITAFNGSTQLNLIGAQAVIDSTGRAQNVLKRIQVHVPVKTSYDYPGFTLDSVQSICKQLTGWPGAGNANGCGVSGGVEPTEP